MGKIHYATCGSWYSPLNAELVARSSHKIGQVMTDQGCVYWIEQYPQQKGRCTIMCYDTQGNIRELIDRNFNVRNRVHEYGGGDYCIYHGALFFVNDRDQRLYRRENNNVVIPLTPDSEKPMIWRYADLSMTPDGKYIIAVREMHLNHHEVVNEVVAIAADGSQEINILASGKDFYAAPRVNHNGQKLLYLTWNHPQMPWDGTELYLIEFSNGQTIGHPIFIAGGINESICQPEFVNGDIYFVSDKSNWWNLYRYHEGEIIPVFTMEAELGYPAWIFAAKTYTIEGNRLIFIVNENGHKWLGKIVEGQFKKINTEYDDFYPTLAISGDYFYCVGAHAACAPALLKIHFKTEHIEVIHSSSTLMLDAAYFSLPERIEFETENHEKAYGYYYAPQNPHFHPVSDELPPLIVLSHGGPTAAASSALNLQIQYWTSRGFAVVDVNYGGSVGYGRAYRERLRGQWGIVDVADCRYAAQYLVQQNKVDARRLIIKGGSAGGYTTLCALVQDDFFALGTSYYGVADLEGLVTETHKFESHYLEQLIGHYPQQKTLYQARSPIHHAEKITSPVIFLQGLEDKVVPPAQTEAMITALEQKQLPYAYVIFPHEQHGFRDSQSIQKALEAELSFYAQILGFIPADNVSVLPIKNL